MFEVIPNWHPFFVHFTVALLTLSFVFYTLAIVWQSASLRSQWFTYGNWNLWLGVAFSLVTVAAGWFAYNTVTHDTPSHAAMTDHRNWAIGTLIVFIALAAWAFYLKRKNSFPGLAFLSIGVLALALLTTTGWRGAELVYRYGLGVMSLPRVEDHSHANAGNNHHAGIEKNHDTPHGHDELNTDQKNTPATRESMASDDHAKTSTSHDGHAHDHDQ